MELQAAYGKGQGKVCSVVRGSLSTLLMILGTRATDLGLAPLPINGDYHATLPGFSMSFLTFLVDIIFPERHDISRHSGSAEEAHRIEPCQAGIMGSVEFHDLTIGDFEGQWYGQ